ncbi:hypothetical protein AVEN_179935-1 [Araneus ventricosus]|uniref:Uncharacterized protein n=1 Tax=Araneus ventricosus TaxID=182803 RepID=A0A4Y2ICQ4_ARAVE|nr:hypothetical protein AVEN_179935-1 [Araneus ventricosus]
MSPRCMHMADWCYGTYKQSLKSHHNRFKMCTFRSTVMANANNSIFKHLLQRINIVGRGCHTYNFFKLIQCCRIVPGNGIFQCVAQEVVSRGKIGSQSIPVSVNVKYFEALTPFSKYSKTKTNPIWSQCGRVSSCINHGVSGQSINSCNVATNCSKTRTLLHVSIADVSED